MLGGDHYSTCYCWHVWSSSLLDILRSIPCLLCQQEQDSAIVLFPARYTQHRLRKTVAQLHSLYLLNTDDENSFIRLFFGRPFVKRFALFYRTVVLSCLSVLSVCDVGVLSGQTVRQIKMKHGTHSDEIWHDSVDLGSALAHQIWPSSVKGRRYSRPQKCQNLPKIVVFGHRKPTQWTHSDEIWRVSVDLGSAPTHQIRPSSVKGGRYRSAQKCQNLPKIVVFGHRELTQWTHSDEI